MKVRGAGSTDVGRIREANEDSLLVTDDLWVVADGMGGHAAGEVASAMTVDNLRPLAGTGLDEASLAEAVMDANRSILEASEADGARRGMGTTVVALAVGRPDSDGDTDSGGEADTDASGPVPLIAVNVGDSRLYRLSGGELNQISVDHKVVQELLDLGEITPAEAEVHPNRSMLTRALGIDADVEVDHWRIDAYRGDRFLLCSDGLTDELADGRIAGVLRRLADPAEAADELVRLALEAGGRDNVTVIVVDVESDDGALDEATAATTPSAGRRHPPPERSTTRSVPTAATSPPAPEAHTEVGPKQRPWIAVAVAVSVIAVLTIALAAVALYARGAYTVALDGDDVVILQGRPDGLLWFDPTLAERTTHTVDDLPDQVAAAVADGEVFSSLSEAQRYVVNAVAQARAQRAAAGDPDDEPADETTGDGEPATSSTTP